MHNLVLSPIDPEKLISSISERVTANILNAVKNETTTTPPPEQFLSVQDAAKFLNLSTATIYSKVSKRELPSIKRGKRLYFSLTELTEFLKDGKRKTIAELEAEAEAENTTKKGGLHNG